MRALIGQWAIGVALVAVAAYFGSLHDFSPTRAAAPSRIGMASALLLGWTGLTFALVRRRRAPAPARDSGGILVVHASQTGYAAELAALTARTLRDGGCTVDARAIDELTPAILLAATRALFIASTTGEGDAPDIATGFRREAMATPLALHALSYGVLALGDRDYEDFCAFGHDLDRWLRASGAMPAFDLVEVDNGDAGALRHWQHHIGQWAGASEAPDWAPPAYQSWRLVERRCLNPGSVGAPCFHVALEPLDPAHLAWAAGDVVEIGPRRYRGDQDTHPHREYSIASLPADAALHLVVRQQHDAAGGLGLGSGWLTALAEVGDTLDLRVRRNEAFHAPPDERPMLLIGNGTGVAGLRALVKQRMAQGHRRNWLLFGERHAAVDRLHVDELEAWHATGGIERLDLVWSREARGSRYVQDRLRAAAEDVRRYVADGAAIFVCGSLSGMAPGVDAALRAILGERTVDDMLAEGRYRRDVY
ncbi:MAG: sulfite reductase subunit alpha [Luteibacter sp.]